MTSHTENLSQPLPVRQIALMVIPVEFQNSDLWCKSIGGMAFVTRQARLAARADVSAVWVLCPKCDDKITACIGDPHYAPDLKTITYNPATENLDDALTHLPQADRYIVFGADCVYDPKLFSALPDIETDRQHTRKVITTSRRENALWLCDSQMLSTTVKAVSKPVSPARQDDVIIPPGLTVWKITSHNDLTKLEQHLWNQCRKDIDGVVSTWFNRHVSLAISRRIVETTITPNQVTVFAVLLGIFAAFLASKGSYLAVLAGAALLQLSSVIDGVDGELARMRVQSSVIGEWLDTIGDDVVNICFVLAIGYGSYISGTHIVWSYMAVFCAALMFSISAIYYVWLARAGRGDILSTAWFHTKIDKTADSDKSPLSYERLKSEIFAWATRLFRRDLLIAIIFFTALFGVVHYSLLIFIPASLATLLTQLIKIFNGTR